MSTHKQLWKRTNADLKLVRHTTLKGSVKRSAPNIPVMFWPDGSVCWPATQWMVSCADAYLNSGTKRGMRNKRGGSLTTKASSLSIFLRFVFESKLEFASLTDNEVLAFVEFLKEESAPHDKHSKRRSFTQVGKIVRVAFQFLHWFQVYLLDHDNLIGSKPEHQITIDRKKGTSSNGSYNFEYVTHRAIPVNSTPKKVMPIGHSNISLLYDNLPKVTQERGLIKRNENILRLLEATGGRRLEVTEITVGSITRALKTGKLTLETIKRGSINTREIPIASEWLDPIFRYIKTYRRKLVKELIESGKLESDPPYLFVSANSGKQMSEETITKLMSRLKRAAGINEKTCAHMFRHRFLTIQVATRLKGYTDASLPQDVAHTILTKVAQLSGHSNPASLEPYIHLAFEELNVWDTSDKVLNMRSKLEGSYRQIQTLRTELKSKKLSAENVLNQVESLLENLISGITEG